MINFFKGHPSLLMLPTEELVAAYQKVIVENQHKDYELSPDNIHPLQYGTDPGNLDIRERVVKWTNGKFGRTNHSPDSVNLTGGASFGAATILAVCSDPVVTKQVFLVSPTYFLINYAFIDAGFAGKMSAIKETPKAEYQIDLDALESKLCALDAENGLEAVQDKEINIMEDPSGRGPRKFYRYVMYLVPTFSNPGGLVYSYETRLKLIQIARKHDLLLISDDVYDYLSYDGKPPVLKMNHIDADTLPEGWKYGNTVSNCSFSKIVAPGLRTGWQETATPALAQQLATSGDRKSGGAPGQLNSFIVNEFIESGTLDATISRFVATYKARADVLKAAIKKYLPKDTTVYGGDGGYFFWVEIDGLNLAESLDTFAEEQQVVIANGTHFEVTGDVLGWGQKGARLCVSLLTEEEIEEGIRKWGEFLREKHGELFYNR